MEVESQRRFQVLKRKLDALHYSSPFEINSMPLIEKLLADLIKTTEGFQSIKVKNSEMIQEIENLKNLVEPLRIENSKIIKENNELH
jgi:centrosomal protein CEP135